MNRFNWTVKRDIELAARALGTDRKGLTRQLGIAEGALRAWEFCGAPRYARLALAAVVSDLDPEMVMAASVERVKHCA